MWCELLLAAQGKDISNVSDENGTAVPTKNSKVERALSKRGGQTKNRKCSVRLDNFTIIRE